MYKTSIPLAVSDWKMTEFHQIDNNALSRYEELVRSFKSESQIVIEVQRKLEAEKNERIDSVVKNRSKRKKYQDAVNNYELFKQKYKAILDKYDDLNFNHEDEYSLFGIFSGKSKSEVFKDRNKDIFNEESRLKNEITLLGYDAASRGNEAEMIRGIEQMFSSSSEYYRDSLDRAKDEWRRNKLWIIQNWRDEFNISRLAQYLIKDLELMYDQPNICQIHCHRLAIYPNEPKNFSLYDETVFNREIRVLK